jgi:hypothetical protein
LSFERRCRGVRARITPRLKAGDEETRCVPALGGSPGKSSA